MLRVRSTNKFSERTKLPGQQAYACVSQKARRRPFLHVKRKALLLVVTLMTCLLLPRRVVLFFANLEITPYSRKSIEFFLKSCARCFHDEHVL